MSGRADRKAAQTKSGASGRAKREAAKAASSVGVPNARAIAQRKSGVERVHKLLDSKELPGFWVWFFSTLLAGACAAALCLIMWTTISPFDKGTYFILEMQGRYADATIASIASGGAVIVICLYLLDFFTAPHLDTSSAMSQEEITAEEDEIEELQAIVDDSKSKKSMAQTMKGLWERARGRKKRDSVKFVAPQGDEVLKEHGLTEQIAQDFFMKEKLEAWMAKRKQNRPPRFVIGAGDGVGLFRTAVGRAYFVMAIFMMLSYGFLRADDYPARPLLMTLLLFPLLQVAVRFVFRPKQHPSSDALMEIQLATYVTKIFQNDQTNPRYVGAKQHLISVLSDKTILETDKHDYYFALACSTLTNACLMMILYAIWTYSNPGYEWDSDTKKVLWKEGVVDDETAWVLWAGPAIIIMAYVIFAGLFALRTYVHKEYTFSDATVSKISTLFDNHHETDGAAATTENIAKEESRDAERAIKMTFMGICFLGLGFWISAEAAGANPVIAHTVKQFLLGFMIVFAVFIGHSMSRFTKAMKNAMGENFFMKSMVGMLKSDWLKGFVMLIFPYWIIFFASISCLNQLVRKCRGIEDARQYGSADDEKQLLLETTWLTKAARRAFKKIYLWNWTSIVGKGYAMGIILFTLNVVAEKCIYLLLIYVGETFDQIPAEPIPKAVLVLVLWYCVGIIGFLLPPVPGPPIYLFGGVVVVRTFADCGGDGFWYGVVIVILFSLILKLNACAMQQKLIGEMLGSQAWVRAACGVQTPFIRAVEMLLKQDGLTAGKVAILCGGPDWPTSVLTGLLRCDLLQMTMGTAPIIVLIAPTVLTGAFFLKEEPIYGTVGTLLFMGSLIICTCLGLLATYAVQNLLEAHSNYLKIKLKRNRKLDWLDERAARLNDIYWSENEWSKLPWYVQSLMVLGLLVMNYSLFLFTWFSDDCFGEFDLQTSSERFDDSHPEHIQLITSLGFRALYLFFAAVFIFYLYRYVLKARAAERLATETAEMDKPEIYAAWLAEVERETLVLEAEMKEGNPDDYAKYMAEKPEDERIARELEEAEAAAAATAAVTTTTAATASTELSDRA